MTYTFVLDDRESTEYEAFRHIHEHEINSCGSYAIPHLSVEFVDSGYEKPNVTAVAHCKTCNVSQKLLPEWSPLEGRLPWTKTTTE